MLLLHTYSYTRTDYISQADRELSKFPILNHLEKQTQVPKAYAALGVLGLLTILIFFNVRVLSHFPCVISRSAHRSPPVSVRRLNRPARAADLRGLTVTTAFGWALPAYFSLRALESPGQHDDKQVR